MSSCVISTFYLHRQSDYAKEVAIVWNVLLKSRLVTDNMYP